MKTRFVWLTARGSLALVVLSLAFFAGRTAFAAAGKARASAQASAEFFASGIIPHLRITIDATNLATLRRNDRAYVRCTVREGTNVYEEVGIHIKGAAGSIRAIDSGEPALTLNFDKFRDRQKFHGLDKLHLNNSVQDGSFMHEAVCAQIALAAGVPTARTAHARVSLNGLALGNGRGLYVLKEGYDKEFLRRHFQSDKGNLYDGGFIREITDDLQLDAGERDVPKHSDLKLLAAAAQEPDLSKRMARMEEVLDVDRFLSFFALEILTAHWDGYCVHRNNYRVYHDPSVDKIVFIPHGMDQMFRDADRPIVPSANSLEGLVARAIVQTSEGRRRYRARALSLITNFFTAEKLTNQLNQLEARLRPALAAISPDAVRNWEGNAANLRHLMLARAAYLERVALEPEPQPLTFAASGYAPLPPWTVADPKKTGRLAQTNAPDGTKSFHIVAGTNCVASWRTRVLLPQGRYVLEARVRTTNVEPLKSEAGKEEATKKGIGAGIRVSSTTITRATGRTNSVVGDSGWQKVEYEFPVEGESEDQWLVCELRASKGEAWFDAASVKLRKR